MDAPEKDTQVITESPLTLARDYLKTGTLVKKLDNFLAEGIRTDDMKIPIFEFTNTRKSKTEDYISVPSGLGNTIIRSRNLQTTANFKDPDTTNCTLIKTYDPEFSQNRPCYTGTEDNPDKLMEAAENSWPGEFLGCGVGAFSLIFYPPNPPNFQAARLHWRKPRRYHPIW